MRNLTIKRQLIILFISAMVVMFGLIDFSYTKFASIIKEKNNVYIEDMFSQIQQNEKKNFAQIPKMLENVAYNQVIQEYLQEDDLYRKIQDYKSATNVLGNIQSLNEAILDIVVIGANGSIDMNGSAAVAPKFIDEANNSDGVYYSEVNRLRVGNSYDNCIVVVEKIHKLDLEDSRVIGYALMLIDTRWFIGQPEGPIQQTGTFIDILDRNGMPFSNPTPAFRQQIEAAKTDAGFIYQTEALPGLDGKIVAVTPKKTLLKEANDLKKYAVLSFVLVVFLLSFPFTYVVRNIVRPLGKLIAFIQSITFGDESQVRRQAELQLEGYAEISVLANKFNTMIRERSGLTYKLLDAQSKLYESKLANKQLEISFLKSQINPHFLYNTLESIKGLAKRLGDSSVWEMTKALGDIFKYSIKGKDMVPLKDELSMIEAYLKIQKYRFKDRIRIEYEIDPDKMNHAVPKMILQPLVENAIYHGLEPRLQGGTLRIATRRAERNGLVVQISDDGVGMEGAADRFIAAPDPAGGGAGLGLANVNGRLQLLYGPQYGIAVHSERDKGTTVTLTIPEGSDDV